MPTEPVKNRSTPPAWWDAAMAALAFISLGIIAWVELEDLRWRDPLFQTLAKVDLAIVAVFAADLAVSFFRAESKRAWLRTRWYEVLGLVPLYADAFSFLRLAQLARLARVLRLLRALAAVRRARPWLRFLDAVFNRGKLGHALLVATAIVLGMAAVVWMLERRVNPHMDTFGEALWWAVVTVTTVGYGDITPQTGLARLIATGLMLMGIGTVGVVASTMSTALLRVEADESAGGRAGDPLVFALERLEALRDRGGLTDDEFAAAKRRVLTDAR